MEKIPEMKPPSANIAFWIAVGGILSFGILYYILRTDITSIVASSLSLGVALMLIITWAPACYSAVKRGSREGRDLLRMGIWFTALGVLLSRIYVIIYVVLDRPDWLLYTPFNSIGVWTYIWGAGMILLAPGTTEGVIPMTNFWIIAFAIAIGIGVSSFTLGFFLAQITTGI